MLKGKTSQAHYAWQQTQNSEHRKGKTSQAHRLTFQIGYLL